MILRASGYKTVRIPYPPLQRKEPARRHADEHRAGSSVSQPMRRLASANAPMAALFFLGRPLARYRAERIPGGACNGFPYARVYLGAYWAV